MERVEVLIDKLKQQFLENAAPEQLLVTVQMLQGELTSKAAGAERMQSKKSVAVIVPSFSKVNTLFQPSPSPLPKQKPVEEKHAEMLAVDQADVRAELEQVKKTVEQHNSWSYNARQMAVVHDEQEMDIPTLSSHHSFQPIPKPAPVSVIQEPKRELNESVTTNNKESSLNDRLKEEKTELAEKLKDSPVKDLKKAVGINDRYLYIIELFSGNEAMFDRSIKTLNSFSILPEAEFWMERELKLKLGWNENNPLVQQFVQLVKRRFS
ncbi:hypothetical protein [Pollutibacter soli]|uniref:hypothetical protein n=1 Tax=Pollutibacter soli TaxID=3034157 RepID=UPI0030137BC7